ncbi:hypothetical protein FRC10_004508, partial [Ceratobasidium sp. 414]
MLAAVGKIKDSHLNPGTILKDNALKLKNFLNHSKSSLASADNTDGSESTRTVDTGASSVSGLPSVTPATWPAWDPDYPTTSGGGACAGGASQGAPGGAATGAGDATSTAAGAGKGGGECAPTTSYRGARTIPRDSTSASATPSPEPEHCNLVEGEYTQRLDFVESLNPAALATHLAQYVDYDASQLSTQDIKALLRAYIEDHTPSVAPPKQQASAIVISENPVGVGGGYHADQLRTRGPPQSTKRPSSPPANPPPKRPKVTIEEVNDIAESDTNTESESESEINTDTESETDTNTIPESDDDIPFVQPSQPDPPSHVPINPNAPSLYNLASRHSASQSSRPASQHYRPATTSPGQAPHAPSQANSHVHSQRSANPRAAQHPPVPPPTSASTTTPGAGPRNPRATTPFSMATSYFGMPHVRANPRKPTEHEREMRARAKVADHMSKLEAKPKRARRGLRIPDKLSKKTAKLFSVVCGAYRKLVAAASGGRPLAGDSSKSRGNLEDDLLPDDEEERVAEAAEAAGKEPSHRRKRKPSSQDVHGYEKQILTTAKMHLFAITLIEGPYQTRAWLIKVAKIVFIITWRQELPEVPVQLPSEEVLQVMVNSLATSRGQVKLVIRPMMEHGLELVKWDSSPEVINRNLEIFSTVHPNAFHCTEYYPMYGHYESSLLTKAIAAALFGGPYSVGVTFRDYFEPMPLTTVAFILANMQFCIEEWETG